MGFKKLFEQGKHHELLEKIKSQNIAALSLVEQVDIAYYESRSLERLGHLEQALNVAIEAQKKLNTPEPSITNLQLHIAEIGALRYTFDFDKGLMASKMGETIIESLSAAELEEGKKWVAHFYYEVGYFHYCKGDMDKALDYFNRGWMIWKTSGNLLERALSLNGFGIVYLARGELDAALNKIQQSLSLREKADNKHAIATSLANIAIIYYFKGNLEEAIQHLQRYSAIFKTLGIALYEAFGNILMILFLADLKDPNQEFDLNQAQNHLKQLDVYRKRVNIKILDQCYQISNSLILKQSNRIKEKIQAQIILSEVVSEKIGMSFFTVIALTNYCELLLLELKISGEEEVLAEINETVHKLEILAQEQQLVMIFVNVLFLKAKLAFIDGEVQQALQYLDQANRTAEERNLGALNRIIQKEQQIHEKEFEKWQELIQRNASLNERLNQARIEDYLREARKTADAWRL